MTQFGVLRAPRSVVFGMGQRRALGRAARELGRKAFICTDARLGAEPVLREMVDDLTAHGLSVKVYDRTIAELPLACIDEALAAASGFGADLVIGVGGGSCMDVAKIVALILAHGGHAREYYGEHKVPGPTCPVIAVPTTAGTGSEVTPVAVLGDPEREMKVGISSPHLIPHTAICDPELTFSCPRQLTAVSGADALTHAIEAFTAIERPATPTLAYDHVFVGKNILSDAWALEAIRLITLSLRRAVEDGDDGAARSDVMRGALLAGLAFGSAGTAAAHAIQYPVGALTHTPHGAGVASLMPYVMQFNRQACPGAYAEIATAMGIPDRGEGVDARAQAAIDAVAELVGAIGIPKTLADLGFPADRIDWAAEQSLASQRLIKNNPRPLDVAALRTIVTAAHGGSFEALR